MNNLSKSAKTPLPKPLFDTLKQVNELDTFEIIKSPDFATNDFYLAIDFLKQYSGNKETFGSYRREVERLFQWSWYIAKKSILSLMFALEKEDTLFIPRVNQVLMSVHRAAYLFKKILSK